jgi:hypothetical protein
VSSSSFDDIQTLRARCQVYPYARPLRQNAATADALKGAKNRRSLIAAESERAGSEIARVVVDKAKAGDLRAAELLLQRIEPPLRPQAAGGTLHVQR